LREHKKGWIIGGSVTFLAIIIGLGAFASHIYWQGYERAATMHVAEMKQRVDTVLQLQATDSAARTAKRAAFDEIVTRYSNESSCDVSVWFRWQAFIEVARRASEQCQATERQQNVFLGDLKKANDYMEVSAHLSEKLNGLSGTQEVQQDGIAALAGTWQKTATTVAGLSVPNATSDLKQSLADSINGVAAVWQEIAAAHETKDQAKFEAAVAKLSPAYAALQAAYDLHQTTLKTLSESLQASYGVTFQ
jgi:hypothetical protein